MKGKEIRLTRLRGAGDGRSFVVAADHPFLTGPSKGTSDLGETLAKVVRGKPDAILLGLSRARQLAHLFEGRRGPALIVRADWFSAPRIFSDHAPLHSIEKFIAASAEEAFAAGAEAVMAYYLAGLTPAFEEVCWAQVCGLLAECESLGLPLIVEPLIGNLALPPEGKNELLLEACRVIAGLGASALKVPFVDDAGLKALTGEVDIPVWVLGGEKVEEDVACEMARKYISLGADGIVFGRNVIQSDDPEKTGLRLREIVHGSRGAAS